MPKPDREPPDRDRPGYDRPGRDRPGSAADPAAEPASGPESEAGPELHASSQSPASQDSDAGPESPAGAEPPAPTGPELARAVLEAAQARRKAGRPRRTGTAGGGSGGSGGGTARRRRTWSGPGPDPRDPQPFSAVLAKLVKARGWQRPAAEATLFGQWEKVVGADVADHCRPVKLERGELTVEAESTAWATQLRLLAGSLLRQIAAAIGHNVVTRLHIHGPAAPSWNRGPRRVRGRGPRDTYG